MKAQETALKDLLEGKRQYVVPLYQRRYAWTTTEWEAFWAAVERQYDLVVTGGEALERPVHFFGSFVVHPSVVHANGPTSLAIIDGQQRFTTIYLLLAAIRDVWDNLEDKDRINEYYLVNKYLKGDDKYKLLPGDRDRNDLRAVVTGNPDEATGLIGSAYAWLLNKLKVKAASDGGLNLEALEATVISRMEVVCITTGADDNAHRIFQTLNSTGKRLSEVDLLRNHFFMLLPKLGDRAFTDYWAPMEKMLGEAMDFFLWAEMVARGGGREEVSRTKVYEKWQEDFAAVEPNEVAVQQMLSRLSDRAASYQWVIKPSLCTDADLRRRLERLREWDTRVCHPLILQAVDLVRRGVLTAANADLALLYVESFMVRRLLAGTPTNNLNRSFSTTAGQVILDGDYADSLRIVLSGQKKQWPSDEDVRLAVLQRPFYQTQRASQRQYVLRRLEESLPGPERPDWTACKFTLEHVMPQHLTSEWMNELSRLDEKDAVVAHAELVHVLGNITLTCENPSLSDKPLERKKEILQSSVLKLNALLRENTSWSRAEITARSAQLGESAVEIWPGPVPISREFTELEWHALVKSALAEVSSDAWTSISDLAEASGRTEPEVREFVVNNSGLHGVHSILGEDGRIDVTFPWVNVDVTAYKRSLVTSGVIDDISVEAASPVKRQILSLVVDE